MANSNHDKKSAIMRSISKNKKMMETIFKAAVSKPGTSHNKRAQLTFRALNRAAGLDGQGGVGGTQVIPPQGAGTPPAPAPTPTQPTPDPNLPVAPPPRTGVIQTFGSKSADFLRGLGQFGTPGIAKEEMAKAGESLSNIGEYGALGAIGKGASAAKSAATATSLTAAANVIPTLGMIGSLGSDLLSGTWNFLLGKGSPTYGKPSDFEAFIRNQVGPKQPSGTADAQQPSSGPIPFSAKTQAEAMGIKTGMDIDKPYTQIQGKDGNSQQNADSSFYNKVNNSGVDPVVAKQQVYDETGLWPIDHWGFLKDPDSVTADAATILNAAENYGTETANNIYDKLDDSSKARLKPLMDMVNSGAARGATVDYFINNAKALADLLGLPESAVPHVATMTPTARAKELADSLKLAYGLDTQWRQVQNSKAAASALPAFLMDYVRAKDISLKSVNQEINRLLDAEIAEPTKDSNPVVTAMREKVIGALRLTQANLSKSYIDTINDSVKEYNTRVQTEVDEYNARATQFSAEAAILTKGLEEQQIMDKERLEKLEKNIGDMFDMLKYGTTTDELNFKYSVGALDKQASDIAYSFYKSVGGDSATTKPLDMTKIPSIYSTEVSWTSGGKTNKTTQLNTYNPYDVVVKARAAGFGEVIPQVIRQYADFAASEIAKDTSGQVMEKVINGLIGGMGGPEEMAQIALGTFDPNNVDMMQKREIYDIMTERLYASVEKAKKNNIGTKMSEADAKEMAKQLNTGKVTWLGGTEADFVNKWAPIIGAVDAGMLWKACEAIRQQGMGSPFSKDVTVAQMISAIAKLSVDSLILSGINPSAGGESNTNQ